MNDKQFSLDLCADIIELVSKKLLEFTQNESQTLKVVKIAVRRAIDSENNKQNH